MPPLRSNQRLQNRNNQITGQGQRRNSERQCCGPTSGKKLQREVKKYNITFLPGEKIAMEYGDELSSAIGIIVRNDAEIEEVSRWKEIHDSNKELCYARLLP